MTVNGKTMTVNCSGLKALPWKKIIYSKILRASSFISAGPVAHTELGVKYLTITHLSIHSKQYS